jgi:hypothetical protein
VVLPNNQSNICLNHYIIFLLEKAIGCIKLSLYVFFPSKLYGNKFESLQVKNWMPCFIQLSVDTIAY